MDSANIQFEHNSARYDDGGTGVPESVVVERLFSGSPQTAANELAHAAGGALDSYADDDGTLTLQVTEIRLEEYDNSCVDIIVSTPDLSTGKQLSGDHSRMVFHGGSDYYNHFRLGIEATGSSR